ncbi:hypothetical protein [Sphingomonas sp. C3-2]|uniref:hypothetical protein n=1 Tax=Sphingomonas sp. C3-2 TaxID=3062169 RepID=UPI00294B87E1|nr:hypothetical protein [Sphingomonas sp. C3-2]WOK37415.1 hypothetical protein QYC26_04290 [Sphingomonas sp. C3-2]
MMKVYHTTRAAFQTAPISLSKWKTVIAAHENALADLRGFEFEFLNPAQRAFAAVRAKWPGESQLKEGSLAQIQMHKALAALEPVRKRHEDLIDAVNRAVDEMLETPAPSMAAMALKLRTVVQSDCKGHHSADDVLRILQGDAQRLSGGEGL